LDAYLVDGWAEYYLPLLLIRL